MFSLSPPLTQRDSCRRSIPGEFKPNEASLLLKTFRTERRSGRNKVKQREDYSGVVPVGGGGRGEGTGRTKRKARIKVDGE